MFIGRSWYVQCVPYYGLAKKKQLIFDIKFHESYFMKCLHINITQNDTTWSHLHLQHLVPSVKTTYNQFYT